LRKYKEIVKEILKILEKALFDGTKIDRDELLRQLGVSEKCMVSIFEELIDLGYIKDCFIVKTLSGDKTITGFSTMQITYNGIEQLEYMEDR
jgi:hypothetical protein